MNLNRAQLIGNVTRDPELKAIPSGKSVASFGVATNMEWKDAQGVKQTKVEYHNITAWGKLAEIIYQYVHKGSKIFIEGRLETRSWEKEGHKFSRTEIVAENMIMLDRPGQNGTSPREKTVDENEYEGQPINLEDIPF